MKILLHTCCGPCSIYPVKSLREKNYHVMGYFYNNNIHPYIECVKRRQTLETYAGQIGLKVIFQQGYDLEGFLQKIIFREKNRCGICYHERLLSAALIAKKGRFDCYSTTLLYSKFQNHELIASIGESIGKSTGIPFYYEDFRDGWKEGILKSKELEMYRQQYCGCIYSEKQRYYHDAE